MSSPDQHRANHSRPQERGKVQAMNGISFQNFLEWWMSADPNGLSLKMCTDYLISNLDKFSRRIIHRWKIKVTPFNRYVFQLQPSTHHTDEIGSGLLPTPTAADAKGESKGCARHLHKDMIRRICLQYHYDQVGKETIFPHPEYLEAVMGFPIGWTELNPSETR